MNRPLEINQEQSIGTPQAFLEATASIYPIMPLTDVPAWRMDLSRVGEPARLPPEQEKFAVDLVHAVNMTLSMKSSKLLPGWHNEYMVLRVLPKDVEDTFVRAEEAANWVARNYPDVEFVVPPAGATPLGIYLNWIGPQGIRIRVHSPEISGTWGTNTGNARLDLGSLPQEVADPTRRVLLFEDISDSLMTTFELVMARKRVREGLRFDENKAVEMRKRLQKAHENGNNGPDIYREFAAMCAAEWVVPLYVLSKNSQFSEAIRHLADDKTVNYGWKEIQRTILRLYPPTEIPNVWVVGPTLDTSVTLSRVRERVQTSKLRRHPLFTYGIRKDGKVTHQWKLRLGLIPGLAYLDSTRHHEDHIIDLAARMFERMATRRS